MSYKTETSAPLDSLKARGIPERCAAARDLSQIGRIEDIPALVDRAASDRSPAVRLVTAGAVADILSRYRLEPARSTLSDADREELIASFRHIDPETNGGLFSMLACADLPSVLPRLAIGLRDPRGGVRVGAAVGLLRYCVSGAHHGNRALEAQVVEMFSDRRLRPDALAEVARVCAAAGFRTSLTPMARLGLVGVHGAFVNQMVESEPNQAATPSADQEGREEGVAQ